MEGKYIFRQSRHTIFFIIQRSEFKIPPQFEHSAYVFLRNNISFCYYSNRTDGKQTITCQVNKAKKLDKRTILNGKIHTQTFL